VSEVPGKVPDSINCHSCNGVIDLTGRSAFAHVECPQCGAVSVVPLQFGNFLLLNPLGVGGMGTVYKAIDLSLSRFLALKILRKKLASQPEFIENFSREARSAAAVNHPNIAQVYSFGEFEGQYYLAMELLERGSLDDRISTLGKLPEKDVLLNGQNISAGLRAAHQRGLLHRDIKPGNILYGEDNTPKIVDFGLARAQAQVGEGSSTSTEPIWGTPYYIAPEKLRGHPEDVRSDIYSLGATLFHALAGRPPFDAATASEVVTKHATQPAHSLKTYAPTIQEFTAHVIGRMLSKNPAERYDSYDELIHDFNEALTNLKLSEENRTLTASTGEQVPLKSLIITLATVVIGFGIVIFVWTNRVAIFQGPAQLPPPLPPPTLAGTNTPNPAPTGGTPVVVAPRPAPVAPVTPVTPVATEEINFQEDAAWANAFNLALTQLAQGQHQDAYVALDTARRLLGPARSRHRQWIAYFEGLAMLTQYRPAQALASFAKAFQTGAPKRVPDKVTTGNFNDTLAMVMAGEMPLRTLEEALPRLPAWAAALTHFSAGFKYMETGDLQKAAESFRRYRNLPVDDRQRWAFALQPLAENLLRECVTATSFLDELTGLEQANDITGALEKLNVALENPGTSGGIKPLYQKRREKLAGLLAKQEEAAALTRAEAEKVRAAAEEKQRLRATEEAALVQTIEPEILPLAQRYDFAGVLAKYEAFAPTVVTPTGRELIQARLRIAKLLVVFKAQLLADLRKQPFDGSLLKNRVGAPLEGKIINGSETELILQLPFGEQIMSWRDLPPAAFIKMGAAYAGAAAAETADSRARRYLQLAAFCKQFGQDKAATAYAQQALQLAPDLQAEAGGILNP